MKQLNLSVCILPPRRNESRGIAGLGIAARQRHEYGLQRSEAALRCRRHRQPTPRAPGLHRHFERHVDLHVRAEDSAVTQPHQDQSQTYENQDWAGNTTLFLFTSCCASPALFKTNPLPRQKNSSQVLCLLDHWVIVISILSERNISGIFQPINTASYCFIRFPQLSRLPRVARSDPAAARRTTTPRAFPASRAPPLPRRTRRQGGLRLKSRRRPPPGRPRYIFNV